ncbi:nucleobase-ascorbate transporter 12-like [Olea europaea var. sylvestris]|uniref:nucleobase-ascorbate transporter 12-like n=1 Tax=Olea europaea var. sylvestris TaxID=158386 RepID=UPI000C1D0B9A|nr:nucleobase-ascorbate transporter 12-like [Olea europaea var. sylvestris]
MGVLLLRFLYLFVCKNILSESFVSPDKLLQYLRKVSVLDHRVFLIYAVPLGLAITWGMAFLLTEAGVYNYKGCDVNVPASNIISDHCRKHVSRMKYCRVDTSDALRSSPWFRFPYPLQWGMPVFHWKMALVMCVVSIISSADSVSPQFSPFSLYCYWYLYVNLCFCLTIHLSSLLSLIN